MSEQTAFQATVDRFAARQDGLPGGDLPWLARLRADGLSRFNQTGLPTRRVEDWKYTDLGLLRDTDFQPAADADAAVGDLPWLNAESVHLVFVNGRYRADLSDTAALPAGVVLGRVAELALTDPGLLETALADIEAPDDKPLAALNTAFMADGLVLRIGKGVTLTAPIEVAFVGGQAGQAVASHPRHVIVAEEASQATLIEHHLSVGDGIALANAVTTVEVGPKAVLRHYRLQGEGRAAVSIGTLRARIGSDAVYENFALTTGGRLIRNEALIELVGEGAHCGLSGAYMLDGKRHCDNTTRIEHLVPNTTCREVFHGVLEDQARAVFQGKLYVARDAQKTDGYQLSKALLLSDDAEIDAKPELEIYADDVKCSHGATAGDIDHEALFYLRSRGMPLAIAQRLLIEGFIGEVLDEIADEPVRDILIERVNAWLAHTVEKAAA